MVRPATGELSAGLGILLTGDKVESSSNGRGDSGIGD